MPAANTTQSYGSVAKTFHWLTALLILSNLPLGLYADGLPVDTGAAFAYKTQVFSLHKTLGVAIFLVALARILWAVTQPKPALLNPDKRAQAFLADTVHWLLYASLVIVPLSGWITHAASSGFAPIWWPFGQTLPFVPKSEAVAETAGAAHWLFTKILAASIVLHIAGALKHHLIDRDDTLRRMLPGRSAPLVVTNQRHSWRPALAALAVYVAGSAAAVAISLPGTPPPTSVEAPLVTATAGPQTAWQVETGTLGFSVAQMGTPVTGSFATWTAEIRFDEAATDGIHGNVTVAIDIASVALGSVTDQAKTPEFFDPVTHPTATFSAPITASGTGYLAEGTLSLKGATRPVSLPFTLTITGDTAVMSGTVTLDRRDFGIGPSFPDEASVAFPVTIAIDLTALRN